MEDLLTVEHEAPRRSLSAEQAEQLVLDTVSAHADSLLQTALRHSLCFDDAQDAYQRGLEIFMRRAQTLEPRNVDRWLHVVVKHEAMAVRKSRVEVVGEEDVDFDRHVAVDISSPEERVLSSDLVTRAAEALQRVKPQELRAMWLKAMGKSYDEICAETGWSYTKVNRCLAEGRKSFLQRYAGIEAGEECERWQPILSALADGEATAGQVTELRPHLRNCSACRATLRGLHEAQRPLLAVLPAGLVSFGVKASGLVERLMPGGASASDTASAGGLGILGLGSAKLAGLLAAGVAATGGGLVVGTHEIHAHRAEHRAAVRIAAQRRVASEAVSPAGQSLVTGGHGQAGVIGSTRRGTLTRHGRMVLTPRAAKRGEFLPAGLTQAGSPVAAPVAHKAGTGSRVISGIPDPRVSGTPRVLASGARSPDASGGEFAPQP